MYMCMFVLRICIWCDAPITCDNKWQITKPYTHSPTNDVVLHYLHRAATTATSSRKATVHSINLELPLAWTLLRGGSHMFITVRLPLTAASLSSCKETIERIWPRTLIYEQKCIMKGQSCHWHVKEIIILMTVLACVTVLQAWSVWNHIFISDLHCRIFIH